jgi:membrane-bound lytic murein transglycosylase A
MSYDGMEHCLTQSLNYLKRIPPSRTFTFGSDRFETGHMVRSLEKTLSFVRTQPNPQKMAEFIEKHFWVYQSVGAGRPGKVLYTGYYEPILMGHSKKTQAFANPIYARPDDWVSIDLSLFSPRFKGERIIGRYANYQVVPYPDRKTIETEDVLNGKSRALAWVKDPVDLFFLQIQGSGKIYLDNGKSLNVHYHTSNGHPYRSIGKLLIDTGKIPRSRISMQSIRAYLEDHPEEVQSILNYNPSYVFFKIEKEGPIGYLGVKLTPGRSIAVDRRIFPLPALAFIKTKQPLIDGAGRIHRWIECTRFAVSQDTGGAIRGPGRADLFWGNGPYAEIAAGHMQHLGQLYFMVLKPDADKK